MIDVSADRLSFSSSIFQGLGADTNVRGISSDGSRAAGFSESPNAVDIEGISWDLNDSALSPEGIGFVPGFTNNSIAFGAWSGGVVGNHSGGADAVSYTTSQGLTILPDAGGISEARDVSSNGSLVIGLSSDFGAANGATFWDSSGINQLNDPFGISSIANAISPNASFIGGEIDFFDPVTFQTGTQAGVWTGSGLTLLEELDASNNLTRLLGQVNDVTNSGYTVGETLSGDGFIWHPSFDGINSPYLGAQDFDDWLLSETGLSLMTDSVSLLGISEDPFSGDLNIALNGENTLGGSSSSYIVTVSSTGVPEPSSGILLLLAFGVVGLRRRAYIAA